MTAENIGGRGQTKAQGSTPYLSEEVREALLLRTVRYKPIELSTPKTQTEKALQVGIRLLDAMVQIQRIKTLRGERDPKFDDLVQGHAIRITDFFLSLSSAARSAK